MYRITDQQIDLILDDIRSRGIQLESLQQNLLDHICIMVEENLEEGGDFGLFYSAMLPSFYKQELYELEEEALFLVTCKNYLAISRNLFFLLLSVILLGPFIVYLIVWHFQYGQTTGWDIPFRVWGQTVVFAIYPLLTLLVLLFTPDRFDPIIPKKSRILLGVKPFIRVVPACAG